MIVVPQSFRAMPRWSHDGTDWLDTLPQLAASWCAQWNLTVTGPPTHGSNALVIPVQRDAAEFVLRLSPPDPAASPSNRVTAPPAPPSPAPAPPAPALASPAPASPALAPPALAPLVPPAPVPPAFAPPALAPPAPTRPPVTVPHATEPPLAAPYPAPTPLPPLSPSPAVAALRFWNGRGVVHLVEASPDGEAMLLERLSTESLTSVPVADAMTILGHLMRRLAVPDPPESAPETGAVVAFRLATLEQEWSKLNHPFPRTLLSTALDAGSRLTAQAEPSVAVNADLHSAQVLRAHREPWLVVDPVLMRGDIAYDLARVLWTRLDEMPTVEPHFDQVVSAAHLDRDRARDWVLFRAVDYWLWGLNAGLTEDPTRCHRLVTTFAG